MIGPNTSFIITPVQCINVSKQLVCAAGMLWRGVMHIDQINNILGYDWHDVACAIGGTEGGWSVKCPFIIDYET